MKNVRFVELNDIQKRKLSKLRKKIASKSRIWEEFTNLESESESRICEDHEL